MTLRSNVERRRTRNGTMSLSFRTDWNSARPKTGSGPATVRLGQYTHAGIACGRLLALRYMVPCRLSFMRALPAVCLFEIPATLLPVSLSGQSLLDPFSFPRFQVKGVFLHFFDDVLLLDLPLEPAEGILYRLALLKSDLCQK